MSVYVLSYRMQSPLHLHAECLVVPFGAQREVQPSINPPVQRPTSGRAEPSVSAQVSPLLASTHALHHGTAGSSQSGRVQAWRAILQVVSLSILHTDLKIFFSCKIKLFFNFPSLKMSIRSEIANETERLTSLCGRWEAKVEDESIPEESMSTSSVFCRSRCSSEV